MKLNSFLLLCVLIFLLFLKFTTAVDAISSSLSPQVTASVGDFYLSLSGYVSPFASIVLTSDGVFIRSTVADENGNFYISGVLIKEGFDNYCLDAIDFKRLGESYTCFDSPPAQSSITVNDIFLPPTLGLEKDSIPESGFTYAYGYTMPDAFVRLFLSNGRELNMYADGSGYYQFVISDLKAGEYTLFATAEYQNNDSLKPTRLTKLKSLSTQEQILDNLKKLKNGLITKLVPSIAREPLWSVIPILIIIIILILKTWPEKFSLKREKSGPHI